MDLVSVIIPYYKKRKFISETVDSAVNQSYKNLEIIIFLLCQRKMILMKQPMRLKDKQLIQIKSYKILTLMVLFQKHLRI